MWLGLGRPAIAVAGSWTWPLARALGSFLLARDGAIAVNVAGGLAVAGVPIVEAAVHEDPHVVEDRLCAALYRARAQVLRVGGAALALSVVEVWSYEANGRAGRHPAAGAGGDGLEVVVRLKLLPLEAVSL